jgi:hypothetical protein
MYAKAVSVSCHYNGNAVHVHSGYFMFTHKTLLRSEGFVDEDAA